jgi:C-terminal processing protease CtpA/Prc
MRTLTTALLTLGALISLQVTAALAQGDIKFERERQAHILEVIRDDVKKNYFDPKLKGIDVEAKYSAAKERINAATNVGQMSAIIAAFLLDFDDSHLFFLPPGRTDKVAYGFSFYMIGDRCFVSKVIPDSEAAKLGITAGDELLSIEGYQPTRENLWKMQYAYYTLRPRTGLKVEIRRPDTTTAELNIPAKITHGKRVVDLTGDSDAGFDMGEYERNAEESYKRETRQYIVDKLPGVFIWKMPEWALDPSTVDTVFDRARKYPAIILDLRGNPGGRVDMLLRTLGNLFADDVKIADQKKRKDTKPMIAKGRGTEAYKGKIAVLIDSRSASASEVFSRAMQLEKRGTVFGDKSAGAVMESMLFQHEVGMDSIIAFATSITVADLIMKDGRSIEKVGVTPDELIVPTGADMFAKRDPALAAALNSLGLKVSPEDAGRFFAGIDEKDKD